jgi:hypothetical protein
MGKYQKIMDKRIRQLQNALSTWAKPRIPKINEKATGKTKKRNKRIKK